MPPVRWKFQFFVITICLVHLTTLSETQQMQDAISMSSDGWRPILGSSRRQPSYQEEITHYKNPSQNSDSVKADNPTPSQQFSQPNNPPPPNPVQKPKDTPPSKPVTISTNNVSFKKHIGKLPPHSKVMFPNTHFGSSHGPHIPLGGAIIHTRPLSNQQSKKHPKPHPQNNGNGKRILKPVRVQTAAHSNRDEVFVAPPGSGAYSFVSHGQSNIKTRETQGLGLLGSNHFVNHPAHIDFNNRFTLPPSNDNVYQTFSNNPVQNFLYTKPPNSNDIHYQFTQTHNDEYTRNLVPPPFKLFSEKDKKKNSIIKFKDNVGAVTTESVIKEQYNNQNQQSNVLLQVPPPFEQNFAFSQNKVKNSEPIEVQVTKEKLKVFHNNVPPNYNPNTAEYIDYDYHNVRNPEEVPKLPTYEVTEGKQWINNPQQTVVFNYHHQHNEPIVHQFQASSPPAVQKQKIRKSNKPRHQPQVELNLPPFLPTPYRPDSAVPTSPTQSEVSTIFSQVSNKMNKHRHEVLTTNPLFFDIKEVSTHYPILGRPEPKLPEHNQDFGDEISNEITTNHIRYNQIPVDLENEVTTTRPRDPQRNRVPQRRRRPINRVRPTVITTTTTEEPEIIPETNSFEIQKTLESDMETERPPTRRRPSRYRTSTTETPISEETSEQYEPPRGKNRYRQRGSNSGSQKKRIKPTELPSNHKMTKADLEFNSDEYTTEETVFLKNNYRRPSSTERAEMQGLREVKYSQESSYQSDEDDIYTKSNRYELPTRHYKHRPKFTQDETEESSETTLHSDLKLQHKSSVEEEVSNENTEKPLIRIPTTTTTELVPTTNIHIPENEVDFATQQSNNNEESQEPTLATTLPTTTTTELHTTTKGHRIRGRPIKYDSSNRPRFSVKDYRQRLNQYTSSTSSTTESYRTTLDSARVRYPNRLRTRPTSSSTFKTSEDEETTTEPIRNRFKPKESRFATTTETSVNDGIITEKNVKAVNTRLRPFGRYRSSTESSASSTPLPTTAKVSIKPNLFSQRRRPPTLTLRQRIQNKANKTSNLNNEEKLTTTPVSVDDAEVTVIPTTVSSYDKNLPNDLSSENQENKRQDIEEADTTTTDILKNDAMLYSQRVSDLTSSFKDEYNTPGLFKSVSPTSRRIPSYFTISTDDPILPIEAFFPNIMDKEKEQK